MTKKRKALSQAEIWDDSALLRSWDEAVEEYQLYHSIHARGERVEDVLKKATQERSNDAKDSVRQTAILDKEQDGDGDLELEDGELEEGPEGTSSAQEESLQRPIESAMNTDTLMNNGETNGNNQQGFPNVSHTLAAESSQDQSLKNLMMSWYWAGYYTGHYEGVAQAKEQAMQKPKE